MDVQLPEVDPRFIPYMGILVWSAQVLREWVQARFPGLLWDEDIPFLVAGLALFGLALYAVAPEGFHSIMAALTLAAVATVTVRFVKRG